ncbi:hypothetical protein PR048_011896 [Dryococelus australis]|uniref:Uncharacterized protein n=1 Tax=Dryococelus australis TaxID=614101 RepID=A0ABQ9HP56_9NEOP|nr:hypothetical protein PR048_011896 [Dryococelus australis]
MFNSKLSKIPIEPKLNLSPSSERSLMYLMLSSRPDLSFAIIYLGKFQNSYNEIHLNHFKNILLMTLLTETVFQDILSKFLVTMSLEKAKNKVVTEAQYVALASNATECLYVNRFCIKICSTFETKRSKHISVKFHFVKDLVLERILRLSYVENSDQLADCLTKSLPNCKLIKCVDGQGISKLGECVVCENSD